MQGLSQFFSELKRRNVFRAGAAYLVFAWLAVQVADIVLGAFAAPDWAMQILIVALSLGFPVTLILSWIYELTVEGVKRTAEVLPHESITHLTGRKLDFVVIGLLSIAVSVFAMERFFWRQTEHQAFDPSYEYSIAVLPFSVGSREIAPLFAQLSDEIARLLLRNRQIRLAPSDAVEALPKSIEFNEATNRLGVRYMLSGMIEMDAAGLGLNVSLYDNDTDNEIWASRFDDAHTQQTTFLISKEILDQVRADSLSLPTLTVDPRAYEIYLRARQRHAASEEPDDAAEKLYRVALELDARFPAALAGLCRLLSHRYHLMRATDDFEEAERMCHRAWTLDRHSVEVQVGLGWLYLTSGQTEFARQSFVAAIDINPNHADAQIGLARTYFDNQPELAVAQLKQLVERHPGSPNAYFALQNLYFKLGQYDDAVLQARWAVRLLPGDAVAKDRLIVDLLYAGMFDEARALCIEQLEGASGYYAEKAFGHLAILAYFEGDFESAAELWREELERTPNRSVLYRNLGDAFWHLHGPEAAKSIFQGVIERSKRHLEIDTSDYYVLADLMVAYSSLGDVVQFESTKKALLARDNTDPQPHYEIAVAASRLGDMDTARWHAAKANELGYPVAWLNADPDVSASGARFD